MAKLSANTLFHFTPREYLLDKFERGFIPRYNLEFESSDGDFFNKHETFSRQNIDDGSEEEIKIPYSPLYIAMVSFCDIPLSNLDFHMDVYSNYGIGLNKEWSDNKFLHPVLYVTENSEIFNMVSRTMFSNTMYDNVKIPIINQELSEAKVKGVKLSELEDYVSYLRQQTKFMAIMTIAYMKPRFRKTIYRKKFDNYSYYNEKEWRYVPVVPVLGSQLHAVMRGNFSQDQLDNFNRKMVEYAISFNTENVKYILVETNRDIDFLINGLKDIKRRTKKYTDGDIELLTTKIITRKQIQEDF